MTLPLDVARCEGIPAGPDGYGVAVQCLDCRRRTAPRAGAGELLRFTHESAKKYAEAGCTLRLSPIRLSPHGSEPWDNCAGEAA